jgi:dynein heavy chain
LNCNRAIVPLDEFRPYDLSVVKEKQLEDEYFTISSHGVVHVCPDKTKRQRMLDSSIPEPIPTEFFSLSDWMHQSTLFNILSSMKFFKHYLIGKVFGMWKGNVRHKMFIKTRQQLAKNLIYSRPAFVPAFMEINRMLLET